MNSVLRASQTSDFKKARSRYNTGKQVDPYYLNKGGVGDEIGTFKS